MQASYLRVRHGHNRRCVSAFTLIELLVVMAVIAILVAILIPALSRARKVAESTGCQSNLKQLGSGMVMYHNDYRCFPPHRHGPRWYELIVRYLGDQRQCLKCPAVLNWEVGRNIAYGYNYKYLGSARTNTQSPTVPFENFPVYMVDSWTHTIALGDNDGTGWTLPYGHDKNPNRIGNHGYTLDPTYVPTWSKHSVNQAGDPEEFSTFEYRSYASDRHLGKGNFLCVDGHVITKSPKELYADNAWWNGLGVEDPARDSHVSYKTGNDVFRPY